MVSWKGLAMIGAPSLAYATGTAAVGVYVAGAAAVGYILGSLCYNKWNKRRRSNARKRYLSVGQSFGTPEGNAEDELAPLNLHFYIAPTSVGAVKSASVQHFEDKSGSAPDAATETAAEVKAAAEAKAAVATAVEATSSLHVLDHMPVARLTMSAQALKCSAGLMIKPHSAPEKPAQPGPKKPMFPDLEMAKFMLHVAGEAYSSPPPGQGYRTNDIVGLPFVTFFRKEVLMKTFTGVVSVKLERAINLRRADVLRPSKAYAVVSVGAGSFRSHTAQRSMNPVWNTEKSLFVGDPLTDALCVRVFDEDSDSGREDLGVAVMGIGALVGAKQRSFTLPLRGPAGDLGAVKLTCHLELFKDKDPDAMRNIKPDGDDSGTNGEPEHGGNSPGPEAQWPTVAFVDEKETDTQVWIRWNKEERKVVCAFRGTESLKDIVTDARLVRCGFTGFDGRSLEGVSIHRGVMVAYCSVRRTLATLLRAITQCSAGEGNGSCTHHDDRSWHVLVTGHSLGGALATLAAFELSMFREAAGHVGSVSLYTYGSPRVGNKAFAEQFDELVPDAWRMTNTHDIVPSVPPAFMGYQHVAHPVRIRSDGTIHYGPNHTEFAALEKLQELKQKIPELRAELADKLANILFSEDAVRDVRWFMALLSRRGIAEHMCDYYLNKLTAALKRFKELLEKLE